MPRPPGWLTEIPRVTIPDHGPYDPEMVVTVGRALEELCYLLVYEPEITAMVPELYAEQEHWFGQDDGLKRRYEFEDIMRERGHSSVYTERGLFCKRLNPGGHNEDFKESFMMGPLTVDNHRAVTDPYARFYRPNVWPKECPHLQPAMEVMYRRLYRVGMKVLRVLEIYLGYPRGFFASILVGGPTVMRALFYPPMTAEQIALHEIWGCDHTDTGLLSVLVASLISALWIRLRRSATYINGSGPPGYLLVQTGDMFKILTGGGLGSAVHKVVAPTVVIPKGRSSLAMFMHPFSEYVLRQAAEKVKAIVAGDMVIQRLGGVGLDEARGY